MDRARADLPTFPIRGPITRCDLPGLCLCVTGLLAAARAPRALIDVGSVAPDLAAVAALAWLRVSAGRRGCRIRLVGAAPELRALLVLLGLEEVLLR